MSDLSRRSFLKVSVLVGAAVTGCTRLPDDAAPTARTLSGDAQFELADNAVNYGPYRENCSAFALEGSVRDEAGNGLADVPLRITYELSDLETTVRTSQDGTFLVEVVGDMNAGSTYYLQVFDPSNPDISRSELITVEAIPDCSLNRMTVNFVPTQN